MKTFFKVPHQKTAASFGLFIIRLVIGIAFMHHGWSKIQHPFDWMGPDSGTPGILLALAALAEFGGGIAWTLGLAVPVASTGILCTMLEALRYHIFIKGDPFVGQGSSYELALVYCSFAILLLTVGPGKFSLDHKIFGEK